MLLAIRRQRLAAPWTQHSPGAFYKAAGDDTGLTEITELNHWHQVDRLGA
jgi:hypothetical protein